MCCEERGKVNKISIKNYGILVNMLSYLRAYCNMFQNFNTYSTPHDALFLVFSVSNAKYLAFGTPDDDALTNL